MWRRFGLISGMVLAFLHLNGQHKAYVGLRGGYQGTTANLSNTILGGSVPTSQVFGISTGIVFKYIPQPQLALQGEVNYSQKGFQQRLIDTNDLFETNFDYLEIPIMLNAYLGKRKTQYFANLGPFVAFLLNEETSGPDDSTSENLSFLYDPDRDRKTAFGLKVAAGIFREFAFGGLQVDAHLTADISDFLDPDDLSVGVPDNAQNLVFGVSVAYLVPFGGSLTEVE